MKRHPSLHALSEHHHHALVQALQIKRLSGRPAAKREDHARLLAREFLRFWRRAGRRHFREEEELLLPAYARHVPLESDAAVIRMLADHAAIRSRIDGLQQLLAAGEALEKHLAALGRALHDHVRLEENEIFPRIEATLGDDDLRRLRLSRLHGARGPGRKIRMKSTKKGG
ncbi:MAG TPA: hemerythrin domain-containing protein [Candidatus Xenobia bacterium]|nr:hemerythrin domain-containing protein [Candidatus Xenobia bacterium]